MTTPSSLVNVVGAVLLHFLWQGTLLALGLGFALLLVPKRWAQARYLIGCLTLAAMVVMPFATAARYTSEDGAATAIADLVESPGTAPLLAAVTATTGATVTSASRLPEALKVTTVSPALMGETGLNTKLAVGGTLGTGGRSSHPGANRTAAASAAARYLAGC